MPVCSFRNIIEQYKKRRFVISCLASAQNHGFSHFTMSLTNTVSPRFIEKTPTGFYMGVFKMG